MASIEHAGSWPHRLARCSTWCGGSPGTRRARGRGGRVRGRPLSSRRQQRRADGPARHDADFVSSGPTRDPRLNDEHVQVVIHEGDYVNTARFPCRATVPRCRDPAHSARRRVTGTPAGTWLLGFSGTTHPSTIRRRPRRRARRTWRLNIRSRCSRDVPRDLGSINAAMWTRSACRDRARIVQAGRYAGFQARK